MSDEMRFTAKVIETIPTKPGCWDKYLIGIFDGETQIGEYRRNYAFYNTFFAFERAGQWYALYSRDYTATRLMSLPDCKDLGGEEPESFGFCPVDFFVPTAAGFDRKPDDPEPKDNPRRNTDRYCVTRREDGFKRYVWPDDKGGKTELAAEYKAACKDFDQRHREWMDRNPIVTRHLPVGFVAGCVWGDDWSWKIQAIDLSRASEGVIKRDERFDYIWLPRGVKLADAIDVEYVDDFNDDLADMKVEIALPVKFKMTGERIPEE